MEYTVDYFINKFSAIDSDDIGAGSTENHCAMFHCGVKTGTSAYIETDEALALGKILEVGINRGYSPLGNIYNLNDGHIVEYQQGTPKERILACLNDIKAKQQ